MGQIPHRNDPWIFQQDSAPSHKAKATQEWCRTHFPDFITTDEWSPCSPDLNPLDFSVWSILEERVSGTSLYSVEDLKRIKRMGKNSRGNPAV